jgi:hypothetical protein
MEQFNYYPGIRLQQLTGTNTNLLGYSLPPAILNVLLPSAEAAITVNCCLLLPAPVQPTVMSLPPPQYRLQQLELYTVHLFNYILLSDTKHSPTQHKTPRQDIRPHSVQHFYYCPSV